ncbi:MAG TPA: RIP metalloprotease RseP, partial [bacterium]|nr:RIP metalloprotease RseP [bacterium]
MGFDALSVLIVLGLAILFHELGHFVVAKLLGVRVLRFSIGFGPKLFGVKRGHTEYILSAIPMGGYVKMAGDEWGQEHEGGPWEFLAQTPMRRNLIVLAGPVMNVVLAYVIYFLIFAFWGQFFVATTEVGVVDMGSPAAIAGIRPGHRVSSINGKKMESWDDVMASFAATPLDKYEIEVVSETGTYSTTVKFDSSEEKDPAGSLPPVIGSLSPGSVAKSMGIEPGSTVLSVNDEPVACWEELR